MGQQSGAEPGVEPGAEPGTEPGAEPGTGPGDEPGNVETPTPTNADTNMGGGEAQGSYTLNKYATQLKDAQASGDTQLINQIANDIINYTSNSTHGDQASNVKMAAKQLLKRSNLPQAGSRQLNDSVQALLVAMESLLNEEIKHQKKTINERRVYNNLGSMGFMSNKWGRFNEK